MAQGRARRRSSEQAQRGGFLKSALNYIGFQIGWLACVMGAGRGLFWLGPLAVAGLCAAHLRFSPDPKREARRLAAVGLFGLVLESAVQGMGLYAYRGAPAAWLAPAWIAALWILLAATFDASLGWLERRPWLCAVLGAAASPFSFAAGARLGAVELTVPAPLGFIVLSGLWFVALPSSFAVANFAAGRKS